MIATPPVFQAQRSNDSQQPNSLAGPNSQAAEANSQDFAGALNDAHSPPARKNPASTQHRDGTSGGQLPQSGNPPPTTAPTATSEAAPARQIANDRGAQGPRAAEASGVGAQTDGAAPTGAAPNGAAPAGAAPVAPSGNASPTSVAAPAGAAASAAAAAGADTQPLPASPLLSAAALASPGAASTGLPVSAVSGPAAGPAVPASSPAAIPIPSAASLAGAAGQAKAGNGIAVQPIAAAPTVASNTPPNGAGTAPNTDSAAQVVMAAAIAQGSSSPPTNSITDFMATDLGTALARGAAPALATAAGLAEAPATRSLGATLAAVTAATAASIAQLTAAGGATGADKHSHAGGSDSFQPGASNDGTAAAQLLSSANSSVGDSSPAPTLKVSAGVDSAEFGQGVADGVGVMMDGNLSSAKLQVNPPALGPIEVRIALQAGHAQVWFTSHSAVTRDALESSAPKLREMLGAQGFGQVSVDISQRSFQDRSPQPRGYEALTAAGTDPNTPVDTSSAVSRAASGLLDAYA
ncbi:MAG TPA: flagellar hook-length control protein FliK [Steroidobacteraceae bacterium]